MKILILSDDFPPELVGGGGVIAYRSAREFVREGHDVYVITRTSDPFNEKSVVIDGMTVHYIFSRYHERWRSYVSLYNFGVIRKINSFIKINSPDVVYAHNIHTYLSYYSLIISKKFSRKVFMVSHDIMPFYPGTFTEFINQNDLSCPSVFNYKVSYITQLKKFRLRFNPFRNYLIKRVLNKIDGVIAVSNALKDALTQNGIPVLAVIHNGFDLDQWKTDKLEVEELRATLQIKSDKIVLFGGRLSGSKGGDLILEIIKRVSKEIPSILLIVCGRTDSYVQRMKAKIESLGLRNNVLFVGWQNEKNMRILYHISDLSVVPSVCFDSFPNVNLESFASKRSVVSTCFGGSREIVIHEENGYIVNPFNVELFSECVKNILTNTDLADRFGANGYNRVQENFSINKMIKKYLALIS